MSGIKGGFKSGKNSDIGYDTSRDSIDKKDLSFEDSPKQTYNNIKEMNINEKLKCSFRKPLKKLNTLDATRGNSKECSWKNLYNSLFKYVIGKKTSLKEIENRIISITEDIEYTTDIKAKKELDLLEQKEKQNFVPSLINKYNVIQHKKVNSPDKKPSLTIEGSKPNIFKKFLNKNLKKSLPMPQKKHPENLSGNTMKVNFKIEDGKEVRNSNKKLIDKSKTLDDEGIAEATKNFKTEENLISNKHKSGMAYSLPFKATNHGLKTDVMKSNNIPLNLRKMSAMDLKSTEDYQIPNEDVVKTQSKMPFKKYAGLLSDSKFIKHIITKAVCLEDLENIKHDIRTYESVLNSMTYLFEVPEMMEFESFINFEKMKEGLKPVKILRKFYDKEKIETMSFNVDEIINKFDAK